MRVLSQLVGADSGEGPPVPIPNTVVKLVYGDNTWLATAREDNSTPTSKAATKVAAFSILLRGKAPMYQYILFDLDGTLTDSREEIGRASCRERV